MIEESGPRFACSQLLTFLGYILDVSLGYPARYAVDGEGGCPDIAVATAWGRSLFERQALTDSSGVRIGL